MAGLQNTKRTDGTLCMIILCDHDAGGDAIAHDFIKGMRYLSGNFPDRNQEYPFWEIFFGKRTHHRLTRQSGSYHPADDLLCILSQIQTIPVPLYGLYTKDWGK